MQVTNRDLVVMATAAFVVAACAVLMMVNAVPDRVRSEVGPSDTLTVVPHVTRTGGAAIDPHGPLLVRVTGPVPRSVLLTCDMFKAQRGFVGDAAWFSSLPMGDCALALEGARPWQPVYPGDELRCRVVKGQTECAGGLATSRAGRVSVASATPAVLWIDDTRVGAVPVRDHTVRVGRRALKLEYPDGRFARYELVVDPDQRIAVEFPVPGGLHPAVLPAPAPVAAPSARPAVSPPPTPTVAASGDEDTASTTDP